MLFLVILVDVFIFLSSKSTKLLWCQKFNGDAENPRDFDANKTDVSSNVVDRAIIIFDSERYDLWCE